MLKQIFATIILSLFYPDGEWLNELTSMDHMVEYNAINLSQIGADPNVVKDNTQWPLVPTQRTDSGIQIPLATFDTEPTHVTNVEEMETSYDKCESVVRQHAAALRTKAALSAAYNIAPNQNTADTPVFATTGETTEGRKRLTYGDILRLRTAFNKQNYPIQGRVLVLCPDHEEDLLKEDVDRYNRIMQTGQVAGFKVYTFNGNPTYSASGVKNAYGNTDGQCASIAFLKSEVMRAMGTIEGEPEKRWADYRGWLLGFQMRFVAMPFRSKGIAAVYSAASETTPGPEPETDPIDEPGGTPTITGADNVALEATATAKNRTYATSNGAAVTASTEAEWLTVAVASNGHKVTFTPEAYAYDAEGEATRTATVTIGIADTDIAKEVTVTQPMADNA